MDGVLAIIGTGRMGEAILAGLLASGAVGSDHVLCADPVPSRRDEVRERHGVEVTATNRDAIDRADVVLVAIKPQSLPAFLESEGSAFTQDQVVLSIVAGAPTGVFEAALPTGTPVVRVMPNTPAQLGVGVSALSAGTHAGERELVVAEEIFGQLGRVVRVPEPQLDAVTAISGSGPAYLFLLAEALIDAGVLAGLGRDVARELTVGTFVGGAAMLDEGSRSATELKEMVTSPGGTTIAALRELERGGMRTAVFDAVEAASARAGEIAAGMDT